MGRMRRTTFVAIGALAALVLAILGACEGNPLRLAVEGVVEPSASFSVSQSAGDPPLIVEFTDESTGAIAAWEWDFNGDGEPDSTEQNPTHVFAGIGKHDVTLRVQGATGSDALTTPDCIAVYGLAFQADPVQSRLGSGTSVMGVRPVISPTYRRTPIPRTDTRT